jgi:alpha-L-rhamnosidase
MGKLRYSNKSDSISLFQIDKLQVNGHTQPLGIDDHQLRFSWQLHNEVRGAMPLACRIWVASARERLQVGSTDIWDSGKIKGAFLYVDYTGSQLNGNSRFWWVVTIWDQAGRCVTSEPAYFDTGLFPEDWRAKWIWTSRRVRVNDFAYFRKEVNLRKTVVHAKMFVSANNVVKVYVGGVRIGGFGSPAPTSPSKRKYYLAYDVTSYLQQGENCISAVAHYLGGSGQNYVNGLPGFRMQLTVVYDDGSSHTFKTDTTWEALREIPHRKGTPYQQNRRISAIEDFDAIKLDPAWMYTGFNKEKNKKAIVLNNNICNWPM